MVGTLWGTDGYFRSGAPALTDYGIGVGGSADVLVLDAPNPSGQFTVTDS